MDDYNLASRTAFAAAAGRSSNEARLHPGVLLYRREDWPRAEDEFAGALNFDIPGRHGRRILRSVARISGAVPGGGIARFCQDDARLALAACGAARWKAFN